MRVSVASTRILAVAGAAGLDGIGCGSNASSSHGDAAQLLDLPSSFGGSGGIAMGGTGGSAKGDAGGVGGIGTGGIGMGGTGGSDALVGDARSDVAADRPSDGTDVGGNAGGAGGVGTGGSGTGGVDAGGGAGAGGTSATSDGRASVPLCPGTDPPPSLWLCRSEADCSTSYGCEPDLSSSTTCGSCTPPPSNECAKDGDCATGSICVTGPNPAGYCYCYSRMVCGPACSATSCPAGQRCGTTGRCEAIPCTDGYACPADSICATRYGSDEHGCADRLCTEGYTCASDFTCTSGDMVIDTYYHGCLRKPCAEIGCAANYTCHPELAPPNDCVKKTCANDADCDCGACVFEHCESRPYVCVFQPA